MSKKAKKTEGGGKKGGKRKADGALLEGRDLALVIAGAGLDKKALNVEIIDVRGKVDYADFVVVMSGRSDRQVNAIAQGIEAELKQEHGIMALGVEGLPQGTWVLMDFGDAVVHVFHQDTRGYYDLESLWIDAARVSFDDEQQSA
ncbi:MAG: ribosome silencing factor [Deltaproteobacteria bacterium]|nr:MAG: ribosome silencing factor [Deltaproteobacteria bacterium]